MPPSIRGIQIVAVKDRHDNGEPPSGAFKLSKIMKIMVNWGIQIVKDHDDNGEQGGRKGWPAV